MGSLMAWTSDASHILVPIGVEEREEQRQCHGAEYDPRNAGDLHAGECANECDHRMHAADVPGDGGPYDPVDDAVHERAGYADRDGARDIVPDDHEHQGWEPDEGVADDGYQCRNSAACAPEQRVVNSRESE